MAWNAPIISKLALRAFDARPRRDSRNAKRYPRAVLERRAYNLLGAYFFKTVPRTHQLATFLLAIGRPYGIFLDPGLGKTKIAYDLAAYYRLRIPLTRALVLVPNAGNIQGWIDEAREHAPDLRIAGITQSGREARVAALTAPGADVVVITYQGWLALVCKGKDGDAERGWEIDKRAAAELEAPFNIVVGDESTAFKNPRSLTWKAVKRFMHTAPFRYPMSGTPFGKDPTDLWTQLYWADGGYALGETLGLFRAALFTTKRNFWSGGFDYKFDLRKKGILARYVRHSSIRYRDDECLDLPPVSRSTRRVICPTETWDYYGRLADALREARGDFRLVAENAWHKMRAMTAGYLREKDPTGGTTFVQFGEKPKLDAAVEWANEIPPDRKLIIFHWYKASGKLLCEALKAFKPLWLYGDATKKGDIITAFKTDPKRRLLIASPVGAMGHNLQVANYAGFFETPSDPKMREQMERRIRRDGQTRRMFIVDFAVKGSIDERILGSLRAGRNLFREIVEGRSSLWERCP